MLQNPGSSFVIWFIVFEGSRRDRNYSPYAIGDISSDYLKRVSIHRFISNHNSGKRVLIGWTKKRKYNNSASTLTYNQPAGSVSISFAKPTFGLTINEDIPSFLKPQVSPDSSEKIRLNGGLRVVPESVFEDHQVKKVQPVSYILEII
ncbi:hypothetical protein YC2023_076996 [Brassica napus]